jgi:hypothetical protein
LIPAHILHRDHQKLYSVSCLPLPQARLTWRLWTYTFCHLANGLFFRLLALPQWQDKYLLSARVGTISSLYSWKIYSLDGRTVSSGMISICWTNYQLHCSQPRNGSHTCINARRVSYYYSSFLPLAVPPSFSFAFASILRTWRSSSFLRSPFL